MKMPGNTDRHCKRPKPVIPPYVTEGYRLPTWAEYQELSQLQNQYDNLSGMIDASSGKVKKDLIRQRQDIGAVMDDIIDAKDIYYVRSSNYFTDGRKDRE